LEYPPEPRIAVWQASFPVMLLWLKAVLERQKNGCFEDSIMGSF